ncbi:unnamed protein product [Symbiodinium sp. CCMP2592]|nr:unnamed protein product [Symbiodinium sp. CCMP2592]
MYKARATWRRRSGPSSAYRTARPKEALPPRTGRCPLAGMRTLRQKRAKQFSRKLERWLHDSPTPSPSVALGRPTRMRFSAGLSVWF